MYIVNSEISHCTRGGVEARDGGSVICYQSSIHHNRNGILIWRNAINVLILKCQIHDNKTEGILVETDDNFYTNKINAKLLYNKVFRNGTYGISAGCYESIQIFGNEIYENKWWGIFIIHPRLTIICDNDIHHNESGGIHTMMVEFKETLILKNKIHHNNGVPVLHIREFYDSRMDKFHNFQQERYMKPIFLLDNQCFNNLGHIDMRMNIGDDQVWTCSKCKSDQNLKFCSRCRRVKYCSRDCQRKHFTVHKVFCIFLKVNFMHSASLIEYPKLTFFLNTHAGLNHRSESNTKIFWKNVRLGNKILFKVQSGFLLEILYTCDRDGKRSGDTFEDHLISEIKEDGKDTFSKIYDETLTLVKYCKDEKLYDFVRLYGRLGVFKKTSKKLYIYGRVTNTYARTVAEITEIRFFTNEIDFDIDDW
jgi:hypothetical protein